MTYHFQFNYSIKIFDIKNPKILPIEDIVVQNPIIDPYFFECQCLLIKANIVCQAAKCENPYPIIDTVKPTS